MASWSTTKNTLYRSLSVGFLGTLGQCPRNLHGRREHMGPGHQRLRSFSSTHVNMQGMYVTSSVSSTSITTSFPFVLQSWATRQTAKHVWGGTRHLWGKAAYTDRLEVIGANETICSNKLFAPLVTSDDCLAGAQNMHYSKAAISHQLQDTISSSHVSSQHTGHG